MERISECCTFSSKANHASAYGFTSTEKKLFELFQRTTKHGLNTIVRVAGGWVRDKLMGKDNDDIDVALDDMTGSKYAQMVHDLVIEEEGGEKIDSSGKKNVSRVEYQGKS